MTALPKPHDRTASEHFRSQGKIKTAHGDSLLHLAAKTDNLVLAKTVLRLTTNYLRYHLHNPNLSQKF